MHIFFYFFGSVLSDFRPEFSGRFIDSEEAAPPVTAITDIDDPTSVCFRMIPTFGWRKQESSPLLIFAREAQTNVPNSVQAAYPLFTRRTISAFVSFAGASFLYLWRGEAGHKELCKPLTPPCAQGEE